MLLLMAAVYVQLDQCTAIYSDWPSFLLPLPLVLKYCFYLPKSTLALLRCQLIECLGLVLSQERLMIVLRVVVLSVVVLRIGQVVHPVVSRLGHSRANGQHHKDPEEDECGFVHFPAF